jgi:hypothetical protein
MTDNQQSSALTPIPIPSPTVAGEGSVDTEMVVNHFRNIQDGPTSRRAVS